MKRSLELLLVLFLILFLAACENGDGVLTTKYDLSVATEGEGIVEPAEGIYKYEADTIVSLSTTADTANGWYFNEWGGPDGDEVAENNILINGDKSIKAVFVKNKYNLLVNISPEDTGTVDAVTLPSLQSIGHGETVRLTANPSSGYVFDHWEGELSGNDNPATMTMAGDKEITAFFVKEISGRVLGANNLTGIEGIIINFSDGSLTTTDRQGYWSKKGASGTVTVTPTVPDHYIGAFFSPVKREITWPAEETIFILNGFKFVREWGSEGSEDSEFDRPGSIAVADNGYVYVADSSNCRIQVFDSAGNFIRKWGNEGSGDGQFQAPYGIAVDGSGYVYVADTSNSRVQVFDSEGNFIRKWGGFGLPAEDGKLNCPGGIAVDDSGNCFVADTDHNQIEVFDSEGNFIRKWYSRFSFPKGIAVDVNGNIYVTDTGNNQIQVFDSEGNFIRKWGSQGSEDGQFSSPYGIAVDDYGYIYVADTNNHRIQVFDSGGNFICKFGSQGSGDVQFDSPLDIAVDDNGCVYVVDTLNYRIQVISM